MSQFYSIASNNFSDTLHRQGIVLGSLGSVFKRIAYRKGRNAAISATARKLAVIIWNMITKTQPYRQPNFELLLAKRKYAQVKNIKSRLFRLNLSDSEKMELFQKT